MIKHMANILVVTASYDFLSPVVNLDHKMLDINLSCLHNSYTLYLHDCFLIVSPAQKSNQVYTNVERSMNAGRYSHNLSPGLRNL
jgi:hypothetical protein